MAFFTQTIDIPGPLLVSPGRFPDGRGYFCEVYNVRRFAEAGMPQVFVQDNESMSSEQGTVRGLHFQSPPHAQAKLIRVLKGRILDVIVDVRAGSPSYGRHVAVELSEENGLQLFVPVGFAHGLCTLVPDTAVGYKVSALYAPQSEAGVLWNDPALAIAWPDFAGSRVSPKDAVLPSLADLNSPFRFGDAP